MVRSMTLPAGVGLEMLEKGLVLMDTCGIPFLSAGRWLLCTTPNMSSRVRAGNMSPTSLQGIKFLPLWKAINQASNSYNCGPAGDVRDSGQVDLIAATQRQVQQVLELLQHREAVGHQQGAVAAKHKSCVQFRSLTAVVWLRLISFSFPLEHSGRKLLLP